jgi:hypothetical protein
MKETARKTWSRWEENIKIGCRKMGCKFVDGRYVAQDRDQ